MNEKGVVKDNEDLKQIPKSVDEIKLEQPKGSYGIAALLAETLEAAVFADCSAAMKAYQLIEQYAYGDDIYYSKEEWSNDFDQQVPSMMVKKVSSHELKMINIDVADGTGGSKTISIPQITMMPLPLLHITEAKFNMDFSLELVKNEISEDDFSMNGFSKNSACPMGATSSAQMYSTSSRSFQSSYNGGKGSVRLRKTNVSRKRNMAVASKTTMSNYLDSSMKVSESTSTDNASRIHMKIDVKMEQADLPEGIKAILQTAFNSMSINNHNVDNTVQVVESE